MKKLIVFSILFTAFCVHFWDKRKLADSISDFVGKEKQKIERIR